MSSDDDVDVDVDVDEVTMMKSIVHVNGERFLEFHLTCSLVLHIPI